MTTPPPFEVRLSAGKGLGVFTTQTVAAGTLLISEPALITFDASSDRKPRQVCRSIALAFAQLSTPDQDKIRSLHCHIDSAWARGMILALNTDDPTPSVSAAGGQASSDTHNGGAVFSPAKRRRRTDSRTSETSATASPSKTPTKRGRKRTISDAPTPLLPIPAPSEDEIKIFLLVTSNGTAFLGPADGKQYTGLFPTLAARMNHDCEPNVVFAVDYNGAYHARTRREVKAGEELVVSYVPGFLSTGERSRLLREMHGFVCACARCTGPAAVMGRAGLASSENMSGFDHVSQVTHDSTVMNSPDEVLTSSERGRAGQAGIDVRELRARIKELKSREWELRKRTWGIERPEPVELFDV